MIRVYARTQSNPAYFTGDRAEELDGVRDGPAGRWLRGSGPLSDEGVADVFLSRLRSRVVGYDIVIAAPRPVSIVMALDERHAPAVVAAHQRAVGSAVSYLEERGVVVRERRFGDVHEEPVQWRRIAAFTHGVNRHGEPHLHDHVVVGAHAVGATSVIDGRALRAHATTADSLYRSQLREEIGRTTSWTPWRSFGGGELVGGLDEGYRALWGGHFDDRPPKQLWTREGIQAKWARDLERFEPLTEVALPERTKPAFNHHRYRASLSTVTSIHRRDVMEALADALVFGGSAAEVTRQVDRWYPELRDSRGLREEVLTPRRAFSLGRELSREPAREREPSRLHLNYRSRDRSSEGEGRSR